MVRALAGDSTITRGLAMGERQGGPGPPCQHMAATPRRGGISAARSRTGFRRPRPTCQHRCVGLVLTPSRAKERSRTLKMLALFVLAALPVAAILVATISWPVALAYVVVQTGFLMFGLRQRHEPKLRVDDLGLQYEAGSFVIRAAWSDIDHVEPVTLPSGVTRGRRPAARRASAGRSTPRRAGRRSPAAGSRHPPRRLHPGLAHRRPRRRRPRAPP